MQDESNDESRPVPKPPRCRGIPIGDGNYTGCAYGYGDIVPFTPPCDCPVCNGSGIEGGTRTIIPHAACGDPDCHGHLSGIVHGFKAKVTCDECGAVVRIVKPSALRETLDKMEATLDVAASMSPYCRSVNLFAGYLRTIEFVCQSCGAVVNRSAEV